MALIPSFETIKNIDSKPMAKLPGEPSSAWM